MVLEPEASMEAAHKAVEKANATGWTARNLRSLYVLKVGFGTTPENLADLAAAYADLGRKATIAAQALQTAAIRLLASDGRTPPPDPSDAAKAEQEFAEQAGLRPEDLGLEPR